ncbi:AraC family transcriptional regulator [Paraflavitalea soli]|uniref:AraC family transcriptional regulator n=2 Tax=Paraflavitalea soli TaxID=2315862 RepID=A0A3B7MT28_9BACT|nr:AraC family transcriptional regulator [Paraflavitalea soli]
MITPLPGVKVISANILQERESQFREERAIPILDMYFSLQGHSKAVNNNDGAISEIDRMHHGIIYTPHFNGYYALGGQEVDSFCIEMDASYMARLQVTDVECLKRFWDKAQRQVSTEISPTPMEVTLQQQQVITDIRRCSFSGHMKDLYLESKVIELFLLQAEQADRLENNKTKALTSADQERLYAARDFVKAHMFEPITLLQVARHCGLNDFKLKKGFKDLFGTTVFSYLNELKMEYGRQMLLESTCTIYEVAYTLGYHDPYNFSKAFRKYFGHLPGKLKSQL